MRFGEVDVFADMGFNFRWWIQGDAMDQERL
jgi:hypothetical protein